MMIVYLQCIKHEGMGEWMVDNLRVAAWMAE